MKTRNKVLIAVLASFLITGLVQGKSENEPQVKPSLVCDSVQKFHSTNGIVWNHESTNVYKNKKYYIVGDSLQYKFDKEYTSVGTKSGSTYNYIDDVYTKETSISTYKNEVHVKTVISLSTNSKIKYFAEIDVCKAL